MTAATTARTTTTGSRRGPRSRGDRAEPTRVKSAVEAADAVASAPKRSVGRRLADLFHGRPRLQVGALLGRPARLAGDRLSGVAGGAAGRRVLERRRAQRRAGPGLQPRQLQDARRRARVPARRLPDDRRSPRRDRSPTRCSRSRSPSTWRRSPAPRIKGAARRGGPDAAVVVLPGQGLRLADDAVVGRGDQLGARPARAQRPGLRLHRGLAGGELPLAAVHDPADLRRPGADPELAAQRLRGPRRDSRCTTFRRVILPLAFPAVVAGSIFTFSLTLGDYITPSLVSPDTQFIGNVVFTNITNNLPLASAFATVPIAGDGRLPADRAPAGGVRAP